MKHKLIQLLAIITPALTIAQLSGRPAISNKEPKASSYPCETNDKAKA